MKVNSLFIIINLSYLNKPLESMYLSPVYYWQAGQSSDFLHSACWWPCPQSPVMQSKLCGCEEFLRHSSVELAPKNEKKPYGYHANLRS